MLHLRSLIQLAESRAGGEWNRSCFPKNCRRVIQEDFVDHFAGERCSVHFRSALDHDTRNFKLAEAAPDGVQVRPSTGSWGAAPNANAPGSQFPLLFSPHFFIGRRTETHPIVPASPACSEA